MGFFTEEIAIDLGTANTLIIHNDKVVINSPSIVAMDRSSKKIIAIGEEAKFMQGKTHENIKTIRPLKDGVIADFEASEKMISELIKSIPTLKKRWFSPSLTMVICIPSGITEVEMRAVKESAERVNGKEVYLIHEPIALSGIVCEKSLKVAGDVLTNDIVYYMRTKHNLYVGDRTAEKIKIEVGSVTESLDEPPEDMHVQGRDLLTGKPKEKIISFIEVAKAIDKSVIRIEDSIMETLSQTPPELAADIYNTGIYLAGGGALLRGLDERLSKKTDLPVYIAEDPLQAVVRGTGIALKNIDKFKSVLIK